MEGNSHFIVALELELPLLHLILIQLLLLRVRDGRRVEEVEEAVTRLLLRHRAGACPLFVLDSQRRRQNKQYRVCK
jgi:hypothetical protein